MIPGGYALINLKHAIERGELPGIGKDSFFAKTFDDGIHLSDMGRYYIGLVHYACIYDKNPVGIPAIPLGKDKHTLSPELTRILEQLAWDSVQSWCGAGEGGRPCGAGRIRRADNLGDIPPYGRSTYLQFWGRGGEATYFISAPTAGEFLLSLNGVVSPRTPKGAEVFLNSETAGTLEFPDGRQKKVRWFRRDIWP